MKKMSTRPILVTLTDKHGFPILKRRFGSIDAALRYQTRVGFPVNQTNIGIARSSRKYGTVKRK